jgi:hypothetical protein
VSLLTELKRPRGCRFPERLAVAVRIADSSFPPATVMLYSVPVRRGRTSGCGAPRRNVPITPENLEPAGFTPQNGTTRDCHSGARIAAYE